MFFSAQSIYVLGFEPELVDPAGMWRSIVYNLWESNQFLDLVVAGRFIIKYLH